MNNDTQLNFILKAVNDATAQITEVQNSLTKLQSAHEGVTQSILGAAIAYKVLQEAWSAAESFVTGSIDAALKASQINAQLKTNLDNVGLSYDKLAPQIDAVAKSSVELGFKDDETKDSLGRLILASGDYNKGLQLLHLAQDLSVSKGISQAEATGLISQVLAGNTKALKAYGIEMGANATISDVLNALQDKVFNSAKNGADSAAGAVRIYNAKWDELQQTIGNDLMPILTEVMSKIEDNMPEITADIETVVKDFVAVAEALLKNLPVIEALIAGFAAYIVIAKTASVITGIEMPASFLKMQISGATAFGIIGAEATAAAILIYNAQSKLDQVNNEVDAIAGKSMATADKLAVAYNKAHGTSLTGKDFGGQTAVTQNDNGLLGKATGFGNYEAVVGKATVTTEQYKEAVKLAGNSLKDTSDASNQVATATAAIKTAFDNTYGASNKVEAAMLKHADAVTKVGTEYDKLRNSARTDLADLSNTFQDKMKSINDSIASTIQQMQRLSASYSSQQSSETATVADEVVASQNKVADLKAQILAATTEDQRVALRKQLADEQKNLDSSAAWQSQNQAAITEAQRRAGETQLQRDIEDLATKQAAETAAYIQQLADLQGKLTASQNEAQAETDLYQAKVTAIHKMIVDANAQFKIFSDERVSVTADEVTQQIAYYNALASAISAAKSGNKSTLPVISAQAPKAKASGGSVNAGQPYIVGEVGQELFVPNSNGYIVPNNQLGGGQKIAIQINGAIFTKDAANAMAKEMMTQLKRVSRIGI